MKKKKPAKKHIIQLKRKALSIILAVIFLVFLLSVLGKPNQHAISYNGKTFAPEFIVIRIGDSVAIENTFYQPIEIAVGRHEDHKTLQGFQEKIVKPQEVYTFTPQEKGVFDLHNHLHPGKLGYLIIDE